MKLSKTLKFIISIFLPLAVGGIAGMFTAEAVPQWYASLNRPSFNPPNYLFGPVWTTLYFLMGVSLFMIWNTKTNRARNLAIIVFLMQLLLNFVWSFIFFYFQMLGVALIEILLLWICIAWMMILFAKVKPAAAWINIPYLLWVSFATVLNAAYYLLN